MIRILDRPKIVFVEDDHDLRISLAEYLQLRGFDVHEAASGEEFYRLLASNHYDVAILDVNLPDASGFDLARHITSRVGTGVILLTARGSRQDRLYGYEGGADLYFVKPVDSEEIALAAANLALRIRNKNLPGAIKTEPVLPAARTVPPGWKLDRIAQTLSAPQGISIRLSGNEMLILEVLAQHPNQLVGRAHFLQLFGTMSSGPASRRFDMALGRLRAKARQAGTELPLQVLRGSGIRLLELIAVA